jgi:hypothetical protein
MHRSGTSLVARLLNQCGLYLGREEDILPPNPTNPEGHWEHERLVEINDQLLAEFGGGWDYPPDLSGLADRRRVAGIERKARTVLAQFEGHALWGWKDPRNSLTLPFWRPLVGPLSVVVCVRNPLEVAVSLRRRGASSLGFGLALWTAYNEAVLAATTPQERVVTHYLSWLDRPLEELQRVAKVIPLAISDEKAELVRATAKPEARHNSYRLADLFRIRVSSRVRDAYMRLCAEAERPEDLEPSQREAFDAERSAPRSGALDDLVGRFDYEAFESHLVRKK